MIDTILNKQKRRNNRLKKIRSQYSHGNLATTMDYILASAENMENDKDVFNHFFKGGENNGR